MSGSRRRRPGQGLAEEQTGGEILRPTCHWDPSSAPSPSQSSTGMAQPWTRGRGEGGTGDAPAPASAHTHIPVPISVHTLVPFPSRPFAHTYLCAWHQNLTPASPSHIVGCPLQLVAACISPRLPCYPSLAQACSRLPTARAGAASSFW